MNTTVLGLDVGTRTIGVAQADLRAAFPSPLCTLARKGVKADAARLAELCRKHGVARIVVGLPYELDGAEGRSARLARQVGEALAELTALPVEYQDERYSTVDATEQLRASGLDSRQQRAVIDQAAAMVILSAWFRARAAT
jgi:putative holliday junction resolvase